MKNSERFFNLLIFFEFLLYLRKYRSYDILEPKKFSNFSLTYVSIDRMIFWSLKSFQILALLT